MPSTVNVAEWERLRARLMCEEMEPSEQNPRGRTPAEAAQYADARCLNAFRVMFPGKSFPLAVGRATQSKSEAPLPGGVTTSDGRTWLIAARVEDDRSSFAPGDRITSQELADTAESYDPDLIHRAPVIVPEGGPGHWTGEYAKEIPGQIDAASFDGYNLWTLVSQNEGGVSQAIKRGLRNRSIGLMPKYSEAGGKPYLRHLLITAETPGITNLRPLDEFFPAGANESSSRAFAETPTRWRTFNDLPTAERTTTMAEPNTDNELDLDALVERTAEAVAAKLRVTPATPPAKQADPDPDAKVRSLVADLIKPVQDENAALKATLTALQTERTKDAEAAKARAKDARDTKVRGALDTAFREGRITAQDRALFEETYTNAEVPDAVVDSGLAQIAKRTALPKSRRLDPVMVEGKELALDADLAAALAGGADRSEVLAIQTLRTKHPGDTPEAHAARAKALLEMDAAGRAEQDNA